MFGSCFPAVASTRGSDSEPRRDHPSAARSPVNSRRPPAPRPAGPGHRLQRPHGHRLAPRATARGTRRTGAVSCNGVLKPRPVRNPASRLLDQSRRVAAALLDRETRFSTARHWFCGDSATGLSAAHEPLSHQRLGLVAASPVRLPRHRRIRGTTGLLKRLGTSVDDSTRSPIRPRAQRRILPAPCPPSSSPTSSC